MSAPVRRITLVMPLKDGSTYLRHALDSVRQQICTAEVDVLIADGTSRDNSLEIVADYPFARLVSSADTGLYDGINRALDKCDADIIGFLNCDDELPTGALDTIRLVADANPDASWVSGAVEFRDGKRISNPVRHNAALTPNGALFGIPVINARFIRSSAIRQLGRFDICTGLAADRGYLLQMATSAMHGVPTSAPVYRYRQHAGSLTLAKSKAAAVRVHQAEADLAAHIIKIGASSATTDASYLLHLSRFKLVTRGHLGAGLPTPHRLPGALLRWHDWRGKLSGY